ncbi:prepilin-type N-terminal cleavage/methylation domain-containing protein [Myxococcus sp. K15C18031901]|uniref:PilW family protein n=1 Tax=Myxococcus dinghuensis TaxID=2906761 RepID=UPI0020A753B0|nr:prepilin-type N-terminal cleavage/methylation domain-containing protein [Myxococcus dinghuensis]MCP3103091.1 prepilin-type N-terminal cleavage/methylation domain-containing protein [Myxococcus dinghuensis]
MRHAPHAQGFTLLEVLIAAAVSLIIIGVALTASLEIQRRARLEERVSETQNSGRAARDFIAFNIQRAGAGMGPALLVAGNGAGPGGLDLRYAVLSTREATFADADFALPTGRYAGLRSDALEVWETDPGQMLPLKGCNDGNAKRWLGNQLCTLNPPLPTLVNRVVAIVSPEQTTGRALACLGVVTSVDPIRNPPGDPDYSVTWSPGLPGKPTPSSHPCGAAPLNANPLWDARDVYLMPVTARAWRISWVGGEPALQYDADGPAGAAGYVTLSREIEQLQVRMGVQPPDADAGLMFFPDPASSPAHPSLDQCTQATCGPLVTWAWDGGASGVNQGEGSARDELMRHVQVVELGITARSQRVDTARALPADSGTDEDGNLQDGYKRRHTVVRLAPRNFGYAGD